MSSNKFSNPWMPASNGVFGGGSDYNKNAYSVRGRGHANNPWVQGSGWWENIVEGSFQQGFGQASHSNEYYSTEPVSLQAMRRMRIITALVAGGAVVGAAAAAGLFSGGGSAAAAGAAAAGSGGTATAGSAALGGLFSGGGILGTSVTAGQALSAAGGLAGGFLGQKLFTSHGGGMSNGGGSIPGGGPKGNTSTNSSGNSSRNPLQGRIPFNPITRSTRTRRRNEFEEEMPEDSNTHSPESLDFKNYARLNDLNNLSYAGNGSYAKTSGRDGYANSNRPQTQVDQDTVIRNPDEYQQNSFEYRDPQDTLNNEIPWQSPPENSPRILKKNETGWGIKIIDGEPILATWISGTVVKDKRVPWKKANGYRGRNLNKPQMVNALNAGIYAGTKVINSLDSYNNLQHSDSNFNNIPATNHNVVLNSPVENSKVSSEFGKTRNILGQIGKHGGTDYSVPIGTEVKATASGKVIRSEYSTTFGNVVIIDHGPSPTQSGHVYTLYAHASELLVSKDSFVNAGDVIMLSGNTGSRTLGEHLHYEVILYEGQPLTNDFYSIENGSAIRYTPDSLTQLLNR